MTAAEEEALKQRLTRIAMIFPAPSDRTGGEFIADQLNEFVLDVGYVDALAFLEKCMVVIQDAYTLKINAPEKYDAVQTKTRCTPSLLGMRHRSTSRDR